MPARRAAAVERKCTGLPSSVRRPRAQPALAEQRARQLDLAAAHEAVDAGDLAGAQRQRDVADHRAVAERLAPPARPACVSSPVSSALSPICISAEPRPIMCADDAVLGRASASSSVTTLRPLRNTVIAVGDRQHVVEEMRDEDDAAALRLQPAQRLEQPRHLRRRQRRGRLVEDDDPGAGKQHARQFDQLLHADRQAAHAGCRDRCRGRGWRAAASPRVSCAPSRPCRPRSAAARRERRSRRP